MSGGGRAYLHRPLAPDPQLGYVEWDGKVYETRFGPDKYVGRVELDTGRIFEARLGPDRYMGRVELSSGKLYRHVPNGPDAYLGQVDANGNFHTHRPFGPDPYVGNLTPMPGMALAGAACLLLLIPALEENQPAEKPDTDKPA